MNYAKQHPSHLRTSCSHYSPCSPSCSPSRSLRAAGFTLVELAISLVVIGLLLAGILKGRELLDNAKTTSLVKQLKSYDSAALMFFDRYGSFPGDLVNALDIIPKCDGSTAFCGLGGNGDRIVGGAMAVDSLAISRPKAREVCAFFVHLYYAEMISNEVGTAGVNCATHATSRGPAPNDTTFFPKSSIDNILIMVRSLGDVAPALNELDDYIPEAHYYNLYPLTIYQSHTIDKKIDDGYALSGDVLLNNSPTCHDDQGVYNLQTANPRSGQCEIVIRANF